VRDMFVIMCTASLAPDYASDGKRGAKLVATLVELIAQQFRGQRSVHEVAAIAGVLTIPPINLQHTSNLKLPKVLPRSQLPKANLD
jgi:hypothetical protein